MLKFLVAENYPLKVGKSPLPETFANTNANVAGNSGQVPGTSCISISIEANLDANAKS